MRRLVLVITAALAMLAAAGAVAWYVARRHTARLAADRGDYGGWSDHEERLPAQEARTAPFREVADGFAAFRDAMARVLIILSRNTAASEGTGGADHSERVARVAAALAQEMGLSRTETEHLVLAALLHDIGKVGIPAEILNKPDALTDDEWRHIQAHPAVSEYLLGEIPAMHEVAEILAQHHERYDGSGYPSGLSGEEIRVEARIFAVADAFIAMTSPRPYQRTRTEQEALEEIRRAAGTQFDPRVVARFTAILPKVLEAGAGGIVVPMLPRRTARARRKAS